MTTTLLLALACRPEDSPTGPTAPITTPVTTEPEAEKLPKRVRDAIAEAVTADLFATQASGASIAIWHDGAVIYSEAFGQRHPDRAEPVEPDTRFQIGSDTKKITALAVLAAVERGEMSLDDTVADAIPGFSLAGSPDWAASATIRDLLSHQGGLYDFTPWGDDPSDDALEDTAFDVLAADGFALAPPGLFWNYANPNFSLAGLALEKATGRSWADVVTADLFEPLGLTSTVARKADLPPDSWATGAGYSLVSDPDPFDPWDTAEYTFGTVEHADETDNAFVRPAGLVWSTASDMALLLGFLVDGDPSVLSDELRAEVTELGVAVHPELADFGTYGFGLLHYPALRIGTDEYPTRLWMHGGNTLTMTSTIAVLPDERFAVVILSNGYLDSFPETTRTVLLEAVDLPEPHPAPDLAEPVIADFVGSWSEGHGLFGSLTVEDDAGILRTSTPEAEALGLEPSTVLNPVTKDYATFSMSRTPFDLTWIEGPDGPGQYVVQRLFVLDRAAPAAARTRPPRDAAPSDPRVGPVWPLPLR